MPARRLFQAVAASVEVRRWLIFLTVPLLLSAIAGTIAATGGQLETTALRVLIAYDGAASCAAYLLVSAAWED